jgi:hypothetical protein
MSRSMRKENPGQYILTQVSLLNRVRSKASDASCGSRNRAVIMGLMQLNCLRGIFG